MTAGGRRISIDSRPSDAVALALRMKSPIYVKPGVMEHGFHMRRDYKHPEKLGLVLQKLTPALARFFGGGEASGLLVSSVREGAPAARAGGDSSYVKYSREAYEAAVASGKPLLLDFYTEW